MNKRRKKDRKSYLQALPHQWRLLADSSDVFAEKSKELKYIKGETTSKECREQKQHIN